MKRRTFLQMTALALSSPAIAQGRKEIRVGTEGAYAPWTFHDSSGKVTGFDIDVANDLCRRMGVTSSITAAPFDSLIPSLNQDKFDALITGMNITDKRLEAIDFSIPYAFSSAGFVTLRGNPLANIAQGRTVHLENEKAAAEEALARMKATLAGKTIGGTTGASTAWFEANFPGVTFKRYRTLEQAELDVKAGRIDAAIGLLTSWRLSKERPGGDELVIFGDGFRGGALGRGVAVGLRKSDTELKERFNKAIREAVADGTLRTLSVKWFKADETPAP